jgi:hypothetical protein
MLIHIVPDKDEQMSSIIGKSERYFLNEQILAKCIQRQYRKYKQNSIENQEKYYDIRRLKKFFTGISLLFI